MAESEAQGNCTIARTKMSARAPEGYCFEACRRKPAYDIFEGS